MLVTARASAIVSMRPPGGAVKPRPEPTCTTHIFRFNTDCRGRNAERVLPCGTGLPAREPVEAFRPGDAAPARCAPVHRRGNRRA